MYRPDKKVYKSFCAGLIFPSFTFLKLSQAAQISHLHQQRDFMEQEKEMLALHSPFSITP